MIGNGLRTLTTCSKGWSCALVDKRCFKKDQIGSICFVVIKAPNIGINGMNVPLYGVYHEFSFLHILHIEQLCSNNLVFPRLQGIYMQTHIATASQQILCH